MKPRLIIVFLLSIYCGTSKSQGLTKNAEGQSSILFKGNSIGFDVTKTEISFGMNNLDRPPTTKDEKGNKYFIKGLNIKVGSEEGVGNLFSKGDLVPAGYLRGFMGYNFSNMVSNKLEDKIDTHQSDILDHDNAFEVDYKKHLAVEITKQSNIIIDQANKQLFLTELNNALNSANTKSISAFINFMKAYKSNDPNTVLAVSHVISKAKQMLKRYEDESEVLRNKLIDLQVRFENSNYWKLIVFAYGGIDAMSFKRFDSVAMANLPGSFSDVDDRGGHFGLGINYQIGRFKFGLTYDYFSTNNFKLLSKKEFTLRQTVTSGTQSLIQEKKITAYAGKFGQVEINRLNFDIIAAFKLDKDANNHLLVNPYVRGNFFSRDTSLIPNTFNIGTGFYLFKKSGKFMGGIYVELPDVDNTIEKKKIPADQNIRPDLKRLTFGLVGRISLGSFLEKQ